MSDESESPTVMKDLMRLMKALFGEERSYATYKEMAEAAEKMRKENEDARNVVEQALSFPYIRIPAKIFLKTYAPSSLKNEEVLDKDKKQE